MTFEDLQPTVIPTVRSVRVEFPHEDVPVRQVGGSSIKNCFSSKENLRKCFEQYSFLFYIG